MLGERQQSLATLQQAFRARPRDAEIFFWGAVIYNQFGEREQALQQLEQAIAEGYSMAELRTAVEFDNLRDHPRMWELIGPA
jgi:tetratricopeptide (TPR) repeat protein